MKNMFPYKRRAHETDGLQIEWRIRMLIMSHLTRRAPLVQRIIVTVSIAISLLIIVLASAQSVEGGRGAGRAFPH